LTGIQVRHAKGGQASRARCAWRNLITWAPMIVGYCFMSSLLAQMVEVQGNLDFTNEAESLQFFLLATVAGGTMLLHGAGAVYALICPRRGVQDILAGTRLVPS